LHPESLNSLRHCAIQSESDRRKALGAPKRVRSVGSGVQSGEPLALQWSDIDRNGRFVAVQRNQVRVVITTPKSHHTGASMCRRRLASHSSRGAGCQAAGCRAHTDTPSRSQNRRAKCDAFVMRPLSDGPMVGPRDDVLACRLCRVDDDTRRLVLLTSSRAPATEQWGSDRSGSNARRLD
jgi:hypothetical protein